MNRIWLLVAIMVLAVGCSQQSVVENETDNQPADKTAKTEVQSETNEEIGGELEADKPDEAAREIASDSDAETSDADVEEEPESEPTPQEILAELQQSGADPGAFLSFAEKHVGTNVGFTALRILAQRVDLDAEPKAKLLSMIYSGYLENAEATDRQSMTAARMLLGIGGDEYRQNVSDKLIDRYVTDNESLDMNVTSVLGLVLQQGSADAAKKVADHVLETFVDDEGLVGLVQQLGPPRGIPSSNSVELLKTLAQKTSVDSVKAHAVMSLAQLYGSIPDTKGFVEDKRFQAAFPQETIDYIKDFDTDEYAGEIEMLLTKVKDEFGDIETRRGTLGEIAENELFVIQNLSIGKEAPEIVGEDLDGEEFKLSDYRGKVVMLDFWGDW